MTTSPGRAGRPADLALTEDGTATPLFDPPARRSALGLLMKGGTALVAAVAGVISMTQPAAADCLGSPCCSLASCRRCSGGCNYSCPSGYYRRYWSCLAGVRVIWCGECTSSSSSCWAGSFYCSVWWDDAYC
ncbi:hypothetical protein [Nonomuraea sp. NPDC048916]|uniref:hypothetical protein n=1 Tax=Nonomuraea sp. NPDC048916 TaxID=3154232 RepID=UPI0033D81886